MASARDVLGFVLPISFLWQPEPTQTSLPKAHPEMKLALEYLRLEYHEVSEGFRHIYGTVWQAGSALFVASGAIIGVGATAKSDRLLGVGFVPVVVWFWGIFWWMDRVGSDRASLLAEIERRLNSALPDDQQMLGEMSYYRRYIASQGHGRWGVRDSLHVVALLALGAAIAFLGGWVHVFDRGLFFRFNYHR